MSAAAAWDARYAGPGFAYGTAPDEFLAECTALLPRTGDALFLAEGEGRNALHALKSTELRATCVDLSPVGLEKARRLFAENGIGEGRWTTEVADLSAWEVGKEQWDAVISIWAHMPAAVRKGLHTRVVEGLKPGGVMVLEAYRPKQLEFKTGGPPTADFMMTLAELREELAGLDFEIGREVEREVHEGPLHDGMSATVQVLARKPV
ncbi:SAM domain-containing protein [Hyaloraphidium curvatum]|nr:SAM domain-containing protein [Hyaloraphidium curvatum]